MNLMHPSVAAYLAGRSYNRLLWHMQQAFLIDRRDAHDRQCEMVGAALIDLLTIIPDLELVDAGAVRAVVKDVQEKGIQLFSPPDGWLETLDAAEQEYLCKRTDENSPENICAQLIANIVRPLTSRVRDVFVANFKNRDDVRCFELGELLDQGIRRSDTYRFMHSFGPWPSLTDTPAVAYSSDENESETDSGSENESGLQVAEWEVGGARAHDLVDDDHLIGCERTLGDLAPEDSWMTEMEASWKRVRLPPTALNEAVSGLSRSMVRGDLIQIIDRLDTAARAGIEKTISTATDAPRGFKFGPVICSKTTLTRLLGGSRRSSVFLTKLLWSEDSPTGTVWQRPEKGSKARTHEYFFSEEQTFQQVKKSLDHMNR